MGYFSFYAWFLSLKIIISSPIHFAIWQDFILFPGQMILYGAYVTHFHSIPQLMTMHVVYVLPTVSNAAVNVGVHMSVQHVSFTVVPWLNDVVALFLFFPEISVISHLYTFPPRVSKVPLSILLPALLPLHLLIIAIQLSMGFGFVLP